ncbi:MAG TPA: hypothetical protein PLW35_15195, partial [Verrucomicrobiota bacterium]|nr:hypothetical protein [Verrucomicrobiota bacterium]
SSSNQGICGPRKSHRSEGTGESEEVSGEISGLGQSASNLDSSDFGEAKSLQSRRLLQSLGRFDLPAVPPPARQAEDQRVIIKRPGRKFQETQQNVINGTVVDRGGNRKVGAKVTQLRQNLALPSGIKSNRKISPVRRPGTVSPSFQ